MHLRLNVFSYFSFAHNLKIRRFVAQPVEHRQWFKAWFLGVSGSFIDNECNTGNTRRCFTWDSTGRALKTDTSAHVYVSRLY